MKNQENKFFQIYNRKYLGSKTKLLSFIEENINKHVKNTKNKKFVDLFGGTGVVAHYFSDKFNTIEVNDFLSSNKIIYNSFFSKNSKTEPIDIPKLIKIRDDFNNIKIIKNTYFSIFGNKYFSQNDADKIGTVRCEIDNLLTLGEINESERDILLSSLLFSVDRIANSMGHYEIYIEREINDKFVFDLIDFESIKKNVKSHCVDANELIRNISGDVLYLDPPYNSRQYCTLYHVLDTLTNWDNPTLIGKGLKPIRKNTSKYSLSTAKSALLDLVLNADFSYIFLSYNNTNEKDGINSRTSGKISEQEIIEILSLRGDVEKVETTHKKYDTGNSTISNYKEVLYICKINKPIISKMIVKYPFNYMGGKFKLINDIQNILLNIKDKNIFIDMFTGGANVGVNSGFKKVYCYDINDKQIEILNYIKENDTYKIINEIENIIKKFDLSWSSKNGYEYYNTNSSIGLKKYNKNRYLKLRDEYNKNKSIIYLIALIIFSFNNTMNFNNKGEFNIPCGKRDFNKTMKSNLILFSEKIKNINIEFIYSDFIHTKNIISKNNFNNATFYFDPPYIVGFAHYNKIWNREMEQLLLNYIKLISKDYNWILSNSLMIGDEKNDILSDFIKENNFYIVELDKNYDNSWFHKKKKGNQEILLTNVLKKNNKL